MLLSALLVLMMAVSSAPHRHYRHHYPRPAVVRPQHEGQRDLGREPAAERAQASVGGERHGKHGDGHGRDRDRECRHER